MKKLLILILLGLFMINFVSATWWNTSFERKLPINLAVISGTTPQNYSVLINITYNANMNFNFSDIKFIDSTETTEYPQYINASVNSGWAQFWVRLPGINISTTNTTIYAYYKNNTKVSSSSNFKSAFMIADDFEGNSLDTTIWSTVGALTATVGGGSVKLATNDGTHSGLVSKASRALPLEMVYVQNYTTSDWKLNFMWGTNSSGGGGWWIGNNGNIFYLRSVSVGGSTISTSSYTPSGSYFIRKDVLRAGYQRSYTNDVLTVTGNDTGQDSKNLNLSLDVNGAPGEYATFSYFYARPSHTTEPVVYLGSEQSALTTTLNSPTTGSVLLPNVTFSWSSLTGNTLVNTTLYINNVANETFSITGTSNSSSTWKIITGVTNYTWKAESCDNTGACANSSTNTFNISRVLVNSQTYTSPVSEGSSNVLSVNVSTGLESITNAYLNYSGTNYAVNVYPYTNYAIINYTITAPLITVATNKTFNWIVNLSGYNYNTTLTNQTINKVLIGNCTGQNFTLYNFTIKDEVTQSVINPTTGNTTGEVDFDLYLSDGTTLLQSFSQLYNKTNPFGICFTNNLSSSDTYVLSGQVQYSADNYVKEFYNIQKETITTADLNTNVSLYDLNSSIAQEFLITYTDSNFQPVRDALVMVQRKYISEGVFKTVEIPLTNANGEALANLVLSDVIYTFTVMKNGVLLGTFENVVAYCDNIATGDCKINLNSYATTTVPDTFANVGNYTFLITYNKTARQVRSSFAVASGTVVTNLLNVTLFDGYGSSQVCFDSLVSSAGTLTCSIPSTYENSTIIVSLSKDGVLQGRAIISQDATPDELYGGSRVFIALMSFLLIVGIGITDSPAIMGIFLIIGVVVLVSFNMITSTGIIGATASALWLIVAVVLIMIKGAKR